MAATVKLAGNIPKRWKSNQHMTFKDKRSGLTGLEDYIKQKALIRGIMESLSDVPCEGDLHVRIDRRGGCFIAGSLDVYGEWVEKMLKNLLKAIEESARKIANLPLITCDLNADLQLTLIK